MNSKIVGNVAKLTQRRVNTQVNTYVNDYPYYGHMRLSRVSTPVTGLVPLAVG